MEDYEIFDLQSFVVHQGRTSSIGHYYSDVKDADGQWYECNDSTITKLKDGLKDDHINQAYILFYQKRVSPPTEVTLEDASSTPESQLSKGRDSISTCASLGRMLPQVPLFDILEKPKTHKAFNPNPEVNIILEIPDIDNIAGLNRYASKAPTEKPSLATPPHANFFRKPQNLLFGEVISKDKALPPGSGK